jgi:hypothetical protein
MTNQPPNGEPPQKSGTFWVLVALSCATVGVAIWGFLAARTAIEHAGIALTAVGIIAALFIYQRQGQESLKSEKRIKDHYSTEVAQQGKRKAEEAEATADTSGDDAYHDESRDIEANGIDLGDDYKQLRAPDVPLTVLGDILTAWNEERKTGRWDVNTLVAATRKTGPGNHPWTVTFYDPDEKRYRHWKVSRGGRSKRGATVNELT